MMIKKEKIISKEVAGQNANETRRTNCDNHTALGRPTGVTGFSRSAFRIFSILLKCSILSVLMLMIGREISRRLSDNDIDRMVQIKILYSRISKIRSGVNSTLWNVRNEKRDRNLKKKTVRLVFTLAQKLS